MDPLLNLSLLYFPVVGKFIFKQGQGRSQGFDVFHGGTIFYCIPQKKYNILGTLVVG